MLLRVISASLAESPVLLDMALGSVHQDKRVQFLTVSLGPKPELVAACNETGKGLIV